LLPLEESHSGAPALEADRFILKPSVWRTRRSYASHNESGSYSKFKQACIARNARFVCGSDAASITLVLLWSSLK
jgi:hypothetical protein